MRDCPLRRLWAAACLFVFAGLWGAAAKSQQPFDLTKPIEGRAFRVSSADPNWDHGWKDFRPLAARQTLTLAEIDGPGQITHLWFTIGQKLWDGAPRDLILECYWDGETSPSVRAPLGDFFGAGGGRLLYVDSEIAQIGGNERPLAYNAYWPMPFARHATLRVTNASTHPLEKLYFHIDGIKNLKLPGNALRFHAQFRRQAPLPPGEDYVVADIQGRGTYAGTVFTMLNTPDLNFGEGDERFFIDGEKAPSIAGTGMEDFINESWGFRDFKSPWRGCAHFPGGMTFYRWNLRDPIPFSHSLKLTFENFGYTPSRKSYGERAWKEFSSVAFWYQEPAGGERK